MMAWPRAAASGGVILIGVVFSAGMVAERASPEIRTSRLVLTDQRGAARLESP